MVVFLVTGLRSAFVAAALAFASTQPTSAVAQPASQTGIVDCTAEQTSLQAEMDIARSRGRMLQRRQIAEELLAVQARCGALPPARSVEMQIESLQKDILEMRKELDRAETDLRRLRQQRGAPVTSG